MLLMLVFVGVLLLLLYAKSQNPDFEITILLAMVVFFAYACGYVAFNQSKKELRPTAESLAPEMAGFARLLIRSIAGLVALLSGVGVLLFIPMLIQYPEPSMFFMMIVSATIASISGYIYFILRSTRNSDNLP